MTKNLVSLVIPTYNRKTMLDRLLKSVLANTYKNIEIIIVDDASSDGTYEFILAKYKSNKKIKLVKNKTNLFTAESRNVGLRKATGKFIFFIDDDNVLDKVIISKLAELLIKDQSIGEVGPVNYSLENKNKILWSKTNRNMFTTFTNQSRDLKQFGKVKSWETDDIPNAFMVRGSIIKKHKIFFRKYFGIMYEESDFAYRIRQLGYSIKVIRDAKIYHDVEEYVDGKMTKDFMYHFMENKKRPYVTARNRIIFHSIYSNKLALVFIILIWIWFFDIYYSYKIFFYNGVGKFSILKKLLLVFSYIKGNIDGLGFVISRKNLE